jgi:hypothetical protein
MPRGQTNNRTAKRSIHTEGYMIANNKGPLMHVGALALLRIVLSRGETKLDFGYYYMEDKDRLLINSISAGSYIKVKDEKLYLTDTDNFPVPSGENSFFTLYFPGIIQLTQLYRSATFDLLNYQNAEEFDLIIDEKIRRNFLKIGLNNPNATFVIYDEG